MTRGFTSFAILGAMRTGSNYLESSLSEADGITVYGELFNPEFLGRVYAEDFFGHTKDMRDADPLPLLDAMRENTDGLPGFRFFQDHDRRVLKAVLSDPDCAKIVLSRNPLHSFISLAIARETGQWTLKNEKRRREAQVRFDPDRFEAYLNIHMGFYAEIRRALQESGQTAFHIDYEELSDTRVLNGLLAWLGVEGRLAAPSKLVKRQNAPNMMDRVKNPHDVMAATSRLEFLDPRLRLHAERLQHTDVKGFVTAADAPLLYQPTDARQTPRITAWLAALDGASPEDLGTQLSAHAVRMWSQANPGFRSFTVVSHPVERAYGVYVSEVLCGQSETHEKLRQHLRKVAKLDLPKRYPEKDISLKTHREVFIDFLTYLKLNIGGRTAVGVQSIWASQAGLLQATCSFKVPDTVLRADRLSEDLQGLAVQFGLVSPPVEDLPQPEGHSLDEVYDKDVEAAVQAAYERDYDAFGFAEWRFTLP